MLISKKYAFGVAFGPLGVHFGNHFGRLCAPWGSFGASWAPKALQKSKKDRTNEVQNRHGRPEGPKERQRRPRTSKMDPKSSKNKLKIKKMRKLGIQISGFGDFKIRHGKPLIKRHAQRFSKKTLCRGTVLLNVLPERLHCFQPRRNERNSAQLHKQTQIIKHKKTL